MYENNSIQTTRQTYSNSKIPAEFDGFKIVQVSDLHNKNFGQDQKTLLSKVRTEKPDAIFITGDLVDRRKYNLETAMTFIKGAVQIAPVYYVSGNHEAWSGKYEEIRKQLINAGVHVMDDQIIALNKGDSSIALLGLSDPDFLTNEYLEGTNISQMKKTLFELSNSGNTDSSLNTEAFRVLLSHRPELFELYADEKIDLVFSGHAHGGQFRIPFIGGLVAPDQGFFPKYTSGAYQLSDTTLIVSRGLGNSIIPLRVFNRPQIVVVTLMASVSQDSD